MSKKSTLWHACEGKRSKTMDVITPEGAEWRGINPSDARYLVKLLNEREKKLATQVQQPANVGPMPIATAPTDGTKVMLWNGEEWVEGYFDQNPDIGWTTGFSGIGWKLVFADWWMPASRTAAPVKDVQDASVP